MVYSGGISNCAYQIGFTKALLNYVGREQITMISASSGGIFTAYALATDKMEHVEMLYRTVDISKPAELFWQVFAKGLISDYISSLTYDNDRVTIPTCFTVCYIPLYSVKYYWIHGDYLRIWKKYLNCATNYPFFKLVPSVLNGRFAIDGGAVDNIPLYPLLKCAESKPENRPDLIFVLHFDARYDYRKDFTTDIPVIELDLSICNDFSKAHYDYSKPTVDLRIKKAFEYGNAICKRLFSHCESAKDLIKTIDEIFLEEHAQRQRNFSIDRFLSFLNIAGKALRNDRTCIKNLY